MEKPEYGDRLKDLAVRVIMLSNGMPRTLAGRHIALQVLRSGTSAGANYCEARGAESRADFAHKMQVVVKELRETLFWLEITERAKLIAASRLAGLEKEVNELISIGVKSVVTAKRNAREAK